MAEELLEVEDEARMSREAAAAKLRELADQLSKHNEVAFLRGGVRYSVKVPKEITFSLEVEVTDDGGEVEVELSW
jgi:amphi-Trp domain-containing protein